MDFPGPYTSQGFLELQEGEGRCLDRFKKDSLHHIIRERCRPLVQMEEQFEKMDKKVEAPSPRLLKKYKEIINQSEEALIKDNYEIILCTCNETASARLLRLRNKGRIAHVIVDECGMAHEPEAITAVSLSNHVVLIGDHKQLQPVIKYSAARENGLSISLFQRYAENFEEECPLITLKLQYRMVSGHNNQYHNMSSSC